MPIGEAQPIPTDDAKQVILDMIAGMSAMVKGMASFAKNIDELNKGTRLLASKIEDQIAALDDSRQMQEEIGEAIGECAGYLGSVLQIIDEVSEAAKDEGVAKWSDVHQIITKLKDANEAGDDEEEES